MKTIIAGGRTFNKLGYMTRCLESIPWPITEVVCGMAKGADLTGKSWASISDIPVIEFPANWKEFGMAAGPMRNNEMAKYAEALVAFWDGKSKGTKHMIKSALAKGLYVKVFYYHE